VALTQFANWTTLAAYINSNPSSPMQMHWSLMSEYFDAQLASGASFPLLAPGTDFVRTIVVCVVLAVDAEPFAVHESGALQRLRLLGVLVRLHAMCVCVALVVPASRMTEHVSTGAGTSCRVRC
jgi:hypothetical protein